MSHLHGVKPSDLPAKAIRHNPGLAQSIRMADEIMTDLQGHDWRATITTQDAVNLTDIILTHHQENFA